MNSELEAQRASYARFIVASAGSDDEGLIAAFADIPREKFLGEGPWPIWTGAGYVRTSSDDPRNVYQDVVVGLIPEKGINNGQPVLHAKCLSMLHAKAGETAIHIGTGTGYYTAVLARLLGPGGAVHAYEVEETLAARARAALGDCVGTNIHCANACDVSLPRADIIYVNAGVTRVPNPWLDALNIGGRLVLPLTTNQGSGGMLMVTRSARERFSAEIFARVGFVPCAGYRSDAESAALAAAFERRPCDAVRSLRRNMPPDDSAWYVASSGWLSTAPDQERALLAPRLESRT